MLNDIKKFLNEEQDPKAVSKILEKITSLLTGGESVEYIAVQKKPALNLSPDCIALTNKRVIFCRPKNLGLSMTFEDYLWKDIADCHMKEGILGATFSLVTIKRTSNMLDYLPKAQARRLYQYAQGKEEEMQEYRRQRELEDKRAAAGGGIVVNTQTVPAPVAETAVAEDPMLSLQKLKALLDNQLISEAEFEMKKAEIIGRI